MDETATAKKRGRTSRRLYIALAIALAILLAGFVAIQGPLLTLGSLRQVDDYPLYVMAYHGGYDLDGHLGRSAPAGQRSVEAVGACACTCFAALNPQGHAVLGRNFDWHNRAALLLYTDPPDGYASAAMVDLRMLGLSPTERGLSWAERQRLLFAPFYPIDGLNEHGLAVGMMAVPDAQPPRDPAKPTIGGLLAIRLLLDRARDVAEAVTLLTDYNLDFGGGPPLHYLIADAGGNSAIVEFVGGEMVVLVNNAPWQVATNFVIHRASPQGADAPCWRYNKAYQTLQEKEGQVSLDQAMALLRDVSQTNTMWSIAYDMTDGQVQVAMGRHYSRVHRFKLDME